MKTPSIKMTVLGAILKYSNEEIDESLLTPEASLKNDLHLDDHQILMVGLQVEQVFQSAMEKHIHIPDTEITSWLIVGDIIQSFTVLLNTIK